MISHVCDQWDDFARQRCAVACERLNAFSTSGTEGDIRAMFGEHTNGRGTDPLASPRDDCPPS
jgi:hypothetical protein